MFDFENVDNSIFIYGFKKQRSNETKIGITLKPSVFNITWRAESIDLFTYDLFLQWRTKHPKPCSDLFKDEIDCGHLKDILTSYFGKGKKFHHILIATSIKNPFIETLPLLYRLMYQISGIEPDILFRLVPFREVIMQKQVYEKLVQNISSFLDKLTISNNRYFFLNNEDFTLSKALSNLFCSLLSSDTYLPSNIPLYITLKNSTPHVPFLSNSVETNILNPIAIQPLFSPGSYSVYSLCGISIDCFLKSLYRFLENQIM